MFAFEVNDATSIDHRAFACCASGSEQAGGLALRMNWIVCEVGDMPDPLNPYSELVLRMSKHEFSGNLVALPFARGVNVGALVHKSLQDVCYWLVAKASAPHSVRGLRLVADPIGWISFFMSRAPAASSS